MLVPAALLLRPRAGRLRGAVVAGFAALPLAVVAIGYPVQRDYLRDRFATTVAERASPACISTPPTAGRASIEDARIGLAGTTAGFLQYGFYGTDLSNRVATSAQRARTAPSTRSRPAAAFRAAVNAADLDYLVTSPFLNFIHPDKPDRLAGGRLAARRAGGEPIGRSGPVTVWRVRGRLDPAACGPANAPLREIPQQRAGAWALTLGVGR